MAGKKIKKISFYYRPDNKKAIEWEKKIKDWLEINFPDVKVTPEHYQVLIVMGGDGTMLDAARICQKERVMMVGLNLGTVGFLASARKPVDFFPALQRLFKGDYKVTERGVLEARILRDGETIFKTVALNEVVILNPLGMVQLKVEIDGYVIQNIRGSGVILSTATGSTAYNLSAHGPVVMPNAKNFILTELLDHDVPTPSVILNEDQSVSINIASFRKRELLSISKTGEKVDVLFIADGETIYSLMKKDVVLIRRFPFPVKIIEFERNYFLKSLKNKFSFK